MIDTEPRATNGSGGPLPSSNDPTPVAPRSTPLVRALKRLLPWGFVAVAAFFVLRQLGQGTSLPEGTPAPAFTAQTASGEMVRLADLRGEIVILNFYATWCPPCRAEARVLDRAHHSLEGKGRVVGITLDEGGLREVEAKSRELGMSYAIARPDPATVDAYEVGSMPTTYVVDREGNIVASFVGEVSDDDLETAIEAAEGG
jgi:peroxiredoxin